MIYSITAVFEVLARFGNGQIVDLNGQMTSASNTAFGFLFTTPEALTVSWVGAAELGSPQALHDIMRQAALSILVVICTYRALFVPAWRSRPAAAGTTRGSGSSALSSSWRPR
jgi:hypothetical protein